MAKFVSPDSGREIDVPPGPRQERMLKAGWKRKDGQAPNKGQTKKASRPAKPTSPASPASGPDPDTEPEAPPASVEDPGPGLSQAGPTTNPPGVDDSAPREG